MELIVHERRDEAEGVVSFTLGRVDGGELPLWSPGAHVDVHLGNGLTRQYSLCSDPGDRQRWRVGVLREPDSRGGSEYVVDKIHGGDILEVGEPRNHFGLEPAPAYVFVAGGIGITPILPMLDAVDALVGGWRPGSLRVERFAPRAVDSDDEEDFEVEFAASGITAAVPPDRSILTVAEEAGIPVLWSCREGTCGTCETPLLDGRAEHRDSLLTDQEKADQDTVFICVSRAERGCPRLRLDL
jgi:ferredoxin-NADP reductase